MNGKREYEPPKHSPWGEIHHISTMAEGIWEVDTAGHGGIMIHRDVAEKRLSVAAKKEENTPYCYTGKNASYYAYEEDAGWAIPANEIKEIREYYIQRMYENRKDENEKREEVERRPKQYIDNSLISYYHKYRKEYQEEKDNSRGAER